MTERSKELRTPDRYVSTVAIAAAVIAAVRLSKLSDEDLNVPKVVSKIQ